MPAKLTLSLNQSVLGEFQLDKERITVGRKPDNDIQVDNLAVSGHHCAIITILNDSFLEDLDSTNGTFVNGKLVKKHALKNGDVISIGKHELRYVNDEATEEEDFEKTMVIRPGMASHAAAAAKAQEQSVADKPFEAASADGELPLGKIQVLSGPGAGKELELRKALITLGRPGVQVAVITRRPQGYYITHVEGSNPVVNGESIGSQARALTDHDVIELARVKMDVFVAERNLWPWSSRSRAIPTAPPSSSTAVSFTPRQDDETRPSERYPIRDCRIMDCDETPFTGPPNPMPCGRWP
ncbi:MAG: FHA domain-containing protein [Gammaproteobacteria bacterium]|nr:FHA domain-containing protein [Gammaproteobacteria bacterium]